MGFSNGLFSIAHTFVAEYLAGQKKIRADYMDANFSDVGSALETLYAAQPFYGTCATAAATAAKAVTCAGFVLSTGAQLTVTFANASTAADATLNVNGTGAKPIYYKGAALPSGLIEAGKAYKLRYNGTQYDLLADFATNGVPVGAVIMFSGSFGGTDNKFPIPEGGTIPDTSWALCDGTTHGTIQTPDLRGKFVIGAGGDYATGDTGGAASVTPTITSGGAGTTGSGGNGNTGAAGGGNTGATTLAVSQIPSHAHNVYWSVWAYGNGNFGGVSHDGSGDFGSKSNLMYSTGGSGSHAHSLGSHVHTGPSHTHSIPAHTHTANAISILPPYYALAFIKKIAAA